MAGAFPGLGKYAQLGSIMAARANNLAAQNQNQMGPTYMNPVVPSQYEPLKGPDNALDTGTQGVGPGRELRTLDKSLEAGQAPNMATAPGEITLPPMPASSMLRDVATASQNRKYRAL